MGKFVSKKSSYLSCLKMDTLSIFAWKMAYTATHTHTHTPSHIHTDTHTHTHIHTHAESISSILILILRLVFWNSKPISIFWANLSRKSWILHFSWKQVHEVSWGCNCKDTEEGFEASIKMNNCTKCLLRLYFYRS